MKSSTTLPIVQENEASALHSQGALNRDSVGMQHGADVLISGVGVRTRGTCAP